MLRQVRNNKGMAIFIAIIMMAMLTIIGLAAVKLSNDEVSISGNSLNETMAFYASESGLERASASIQAQYEATNSPPTTLPSGSEVLDDCVSAYNTVDNGAAVQRPLTQGTLAGLNALVKTYTITSMGLSSIDGSQITLVQEFECAMVPIFQFAVFYGNDLEIAPGPDMTLLGRVHSNGNLWLQAGSSLYMDSYVTCSGNLLYGRKGGGGTATGNIFIKDTDGNYQNMKNGDGTFLESSDACWYDSASTRWGGRVQDSAFGQGPLNMPLSNSGDPHKIIERASGNSDSYENLADLRIIDGQVEQRVGAAWVNISAFLPANTITTITFYDGREGTNVSTTEIDMDLLTTSGYFPANEVIYFSDSRTSFDAARLVNGDDLNGHAMSFYSENPIYVQGDFNSNDKQPVALAGDAITFLSNSWADSNSTKSKYNRTASATTVNASIMTGNTNTTPSNYNGGLENLPRFLEVWSGKKFTYSGSLVNLWNSQQATGVWSGTYYSPPIRDWSYDPDLDDPSKLPPETPTVRIFQRIGWRQDDLALEGS